MARLEREAGAIDARPAADVHLTGKSNRRTHSDVLAPVVIKSNRIFFNSSCNISLLLPLFLVHL